MLLDLTGKLILAEYHETYGLLCVMPESPKDASEQAVTRSCGFCCFVICLYRRSRFLARQRISDVIPFQRKRNFGVLDRHQRLYIYD